MLERSQDFEIVKSILHVLELGSPKYSSRCLTITPGDPYDHFIKARIKQSLLSSQRKSARFCGVDTNLVLNHSTEIFRRIDDSDFIAHSTTIAQDLHHQMNNGRRTKSADLSFSLCRKDDNTYFIAILLLEFENSIFHKEEIDPLTGEEYYNFVDNIMTLSQNRKLLLAAFIKRYTATDTYNLIVDNNAVSSPFFFNQFLNAEHIFDSNDLTDKYFEVIQDVYLMDKENDLINKYLDEVSVHQSFNIDEFSEECNLLPEQVEVLNRKLNNLDIVEREININNEYVRKKYRRKVYSTPQGINIRVPIDLANKIKEVNGNIVIEDSAISSVKLKQT